MSAFLDDLARALAEPVPRRRALGIVGRALLAAALPAVLRPTAARADCAPCDQGVLCSVPRGVGCIRLCCDATDLCCTAQDAVVCCSPGELYTCGTKEVGGAQIPVCVPKCVTDDGAAGEPCGENCCTSAEVCCNGSCCTGAQVCCNGTCCGVSRVCYDNRLCCSQSAELCSGPGGALDCCDDGETCCAGTCCPTNQKCSKHKRKLVCKCKKKGKKCGRARCCEGDTCCVDTCCAPGEICDVQNGSGLCLPALT